MQVKVKFSMSSNPMTSKCDSRIRKPYNTPKLQKFGDIRDVTLGGSPTYIESGGFMASGRPEGNSRGSRQRDE